jgi:hypothetical protein
MEEPDTLRGEGREERPQVRRIRLRILTEVGHWPVLFKERDGDLAPFMSGKGDAGVDLICGGCDHVLVDHIYPADKISGIVFCCPVCNAYNLA